jgi:hypothetical protein
MAGQQPETLSQRTEKPRDDWANFVKDCRRRLLQCDDAAAATGERASESAIE